MDWNFWSVRRGYIGQRRIEGLDITDLRRRFWDPIDATGVQILGNDIGITTAEAQPDSAASNGSAVPRHRRRYESPSSAMSISGNTSTKWTLFRYGSSAMMEAISSAPTQPVPRRSRILSEWR